MVKLFRCKERIIIQRQKVFPIVHPTPVLPIAVKVVDRLLRNISEQPESEGGYFP